LPPAGGRVRDRSPEAARLLTRPSGRLAYWMRALGRRAQAQAAVRARVDDERSPAERPDPPTPRDQPALSDGAPAAAPVAPADGPRALVGQSLGSDGRRGPDRTAPDRTG